MNTKALKGTPVAPIVPPPLATPNPPPAAGGADGATPPPAVVAPAPRPASIRRRMLRVVMTTTLVALLLSCTALLLYELQTHRASWAQDLRTQADLVARTSVPALSFDDTRVATENLALLRLRPQIEMAALYDASGRLFASYAVPGLPPPPARLPPPPPDTLFEGDTFELQQPIRQAGADSADGGERLGTMVLRARYHVLPRLLDYLSILGTVTLASLALAALVARRLQSAITDPIVAVSDVAREVVQHRNFALRAPRTTNDEVGALVDAFNDMLRELGEQARELQATDRRKDEFLATLAHELRNPLAPVSTALAILERGDVDAATQARLVAMMQRQMQQFVRLIDDLMEVSRISTGRLAPRLERLDLVQVLRGAVESVAPVLLERRHALVADWPPPVWVQGDRTRLGQVFVNLLANAAKYTEPGGRIEIAFTLEPDQVAVHITDNGIGVAAEMQREVFEMFVQVDRSIEGGRSGLGVGLSLARQLVALHDGSLTLYSEGLGCGSTFTVRLPRQPAPPAAQEPEARAAMAAAAAATAQARAHAAAGLGALAGAQGAHRAADGGGQAGGQGGDQALATAPAAVSPPAAPAPAAPAPGRRLNVLLADDNRDFVDSLAAVLQGAGHAVRVAYDGHGALRALGDALPDVGLFDVGMPGTDGYALAAAVRRQPGGNRCLLVAITGWGQPSDRQRAHEAGFDEHLVKPVDIEALTRLLAQRA